MFDKLFGFVVDFYHSNSAIWIYLVIPITAAIVGWGTNVLAIKMTFYPLEYKGIFPFGWQGIIPQKAGRMAGKSVDLMLGTLIDVEERFSQIDPQRVVVEMYPTLEKLTNEIMEASMSKHLPLAWMLMPQRAKNEIMQQALKEFPASVEQLMWDMRDNIKDLYDVRGMIVHELETNKQMLNDLFLKCGAEEFKFIERSGLYFGFLFGLVQMVIWYFYEAWWQLPLGGLLVGYLTNYLALKMIFEPKKPFKFLFWNIQGLFMKRQAAVADEYAKIVSANILTPEKMFTSILTGPAANQLHAIIERNVSKAVDKTAGFNRSLIQLSSGTKAYNGMKEVAVQKFQEAFPKAISDIYDYAGQALDLENVFRDRMSSLPPDDFEGVLRPAFQEDEWKLILTGAILGGIAGILQLFTLL